MTRATIVDGLAVIRCPDPQCDRPMSVTGLPLLPEAFLSACPACRGKIVLARTSAGEAIAARMKLNGAGEVELVGESS